jgi:hypothetical protein
MKRRRAPPFAKAAGSRPGTSLAWMHRAVSTSSVARKDLIRSGFNVYPVELNRFCRCFPASHKLRLSAATSATTRKSSRSCSGASPGAIACNYRLGWRRVMY